MSVKRIIIASVLKPVDDPRMYYKMARSLSKTEGVTVTVIGSEGKIREKNNIAMVPLFRFNRADILRRVLAPWKFLFFVLKQKPALLIVCTHELLLPGLFVKLFCRTRLIYDIRENYKLNILHTGAFPFFLRNILSIWVRTGEVCLAPFIDHFFLAEEIYKHQLPFVGSRYSILENKCLKIKTQTVPRDTGSSFLFSGTLAEETGVFRCLAFMDRVVREDEGATLTIIGYCPQDGVFRRLKEKALKRPWVSLKIRNRALSYEEILGAIRQADVGVICYLPLLHTREKNPTKLFEYIGHRLPVIVEGTHTGKGLLDRYDAGVVIEDLLTCKIPDILDRLREGGFYAEGIGEEVYWGSEEEKIKKIINYKL